MNVETFRVGFLRLQFLALDVAVVVYAAYVLFTDGVSGFATVLAVLAVSMAVGWHFGVVQIKDSGLVLYRTHEVQWRQVSGVRQVSVLGLPYLLIRRVSGFSWYLPLYVIDPPSLVESLVARAPQGTQFARALRHAEPPSSPGRRHVA